MRSGRLIQAECKDLSQRYPQDIGINIFNFPGLVIYPGVRGDFEQCVAQKSGDRGLGVWIKTRLVDL